MDDMIDCRACRKDIKWIYTMDIELEDPDIECHFCLECWKYIEKAVLMDIEARRLTIPRKSGV